MWVVAGTPHLRFTRDTHGDEPKYLRYCENFYQGHGLEIFSIQPLASLPSGFQPHFGRNFRLAAEILPGELAELASDVGLFLADPSHRFTRSVKERGFIRGKTGGEYQVHQPGLSLMMLPAYYIDRQLDSPVPGSTRQWPSKLVAVNTFFLGLYLLWIVLIYRFLRHLAEARSIAWVAALTFGLTLPAAAFPFQFYPEVAAGVLLFAAGAHLAFPERPTRTASFFVGLLVGYLPWLHVRFSALAAVLVAFAITSMRHDLRRLAAFLGGFAVPAVLLALFPLFASPAAYLCSEWQCGGQEDGGNGKPAEKRRQTSQVVPHRGDAKATSTAARALNLTSGTADIPRAVRRRTSTPCRGWGKPGGLQRRTAAHRRDFRVELEGNARPAASGRLRPRPMQ